MIGKLDATLVPINITVISLLHLLKLLSVFNCRYGKNGYKSLLITLCRAISIVNGFIKVYNIAQWQVQIFLRL